MIWSSKVKGTDAALRSSLLVSIGVDPKSSLGSEFRIVCRVAATQPERPCPRGVRS